MVCFPCQAHKRWILTEQELVIYCSLAKGQRFRVPAKMAIMVRTWYSTPILHYSPKEKIYPQTVAPLWICASFGGIQLLSHEVMLVSGRMLLKHSKDAISEFFVEGSRLKTERCRGMHRCSRARPHKVPHASSVPSQSHALAQARPRQAF